MAVKGTFVAAPKFNTKEDAQKMVDLYFKECEGEALTDENGKAVYTSKGDVVYIRQPKPPTVTGLALALGFAARKELLTYRGPRDIMEVIERAKSRVEEYMERQLFEQDSFKWARLGLEKDFGMSFDEEEQGGKVIIVDDIPEGAGSRAENEPKTDGGAGEAGREAEKRQEAEIGAEAEKKEEAEAEIEENGEEKEAGKVHEERGQEAGKMEAEEKTGRKACDFTYGGALGAAENETS